MQHGHDRERLVAFYKFVSAGQRSFVSAQKSAVFAIHVELHYSTIIVENKFMVFVVHEWLAIGDT
jgi:hypothetical protein